MDAAKPKSGLVLPPWRRPPWRPAPDAEVEAAAWAAELTTQQMEGELWAAELEEQAAAVELAAAEEAAAAAAEAAAAAQAAAEAAEVAAAAEAAEADAPAASSSLAPADEESEEWWPSNRSLYLATHGRKRKRGGKSAREYRQRWGKICSPAPTPLHVFFALDLKDTCQTCLDIL